VPVCRVWKGESIVTKKNNRAKLLAKIIALHAMLGSDNAGEAQNARDKLKQLLEKNRLNWNDLPSLIAEAKASEVPASKDPLKDDDTAAQDISINALYFVHGMLQAHIRAEPHQLVAIALWVLHCHTYRQFMVSPRLTLTSPVRGCGKSLTLSIVEHLVHPVHRTDSISPAAVYRLIDREHRTLLVDEADNAGLLTNGLLRAIFNSGHRKGGKATRVIKDGVHSFSTYAPMAVASIGSLPLPLMHRSVVIPMKRDDGTVPLLRFDDNDPETLNILSTIYGQVYQWARDVKLDLNPNLPIELRNREADNWRPLIAIADSFSTDWGKRAREAAITFSQGHRDEDLAVVMLGDIRTAYDSRRIDRFASKALTDTLVAMDDAPWSEWRGIHDDQSPRRLSQGQLAMVLRLFNIKPRSIRFGTTTAKGYYRHQFEQAWAAYCSRADTPAQDNNIRRLYVA
jgi:hypothetical protein